MAVRVSTWPEQVSQVLQLVVEHCPSARDPRLVCTLLELSTGCRKLLQQTRGQCRVQLEAVHVRQCSDFVTWLRSHPGLVKELVLLGANPAPPYSGYDDYSIYAPYGGSYGGYGGYGYGGYGYGGYYGGNAPCLPDVISKMLATGFSLCTVQAAQQVAGASVLSAGPLPLRLHRVAIRNPDSRAIYGVDGIPRTFASVPLLGALAAAGVQRLEVDVTLAAAEKAVASSLSTLTTLQELVLTLSPASYQYEDRPSTGRLCTALHPLSKLTRLEALVNPGAACNLPPSLRELELLARPPVRDSYRMRPPWTAAEPEVQPDQIGLADLSHLTALTHLTLRNTEPDTDAIWHPAPVDTSIATSVLEVSLPADLQQLRVFGYACISGLHRLGRAEVNAYAPCDLDILQQLAPLQHPWALELRVCFHRHRRRCPSSDSDMSDSDDEDDDPYEAGLEAVQEAHAVAASALGFSSHLSSLLIRDSLLIRETGSPWSSIPWCEAVAGLQHLQEICIAEAIPEPQTLRHLKALPALRSLTFRDDSPSEAMAVSLLSDLTGLQELRMNCGRMSSVAVLAGVSALTGLSRLELYGWDHDVRMRDDELPLLLPLQRLRVLYLAPLWHCSTAGLDHLRQQLPLLQGWVFS